MMVCALFSASQSIRAVLRCACASVVPCASSTRPHASVTRSTAVAGVNRELPHLRIQPRPRLDPFRRGLRRTLTRPGDDQRHGKGRRHRRRRRDTCGRDAAEDAPAASTSSRCCPASTSGSSRSSATTTEELLGPPTDGVMDGAHGKIEAVDQDGLEPTLEPAAALERVDKVLRYSPSQILDLVAKTSPRPATPPRSALLDCWRHFFYRILEQTHGCGAATDPLSEDVGMARFHFEHECAHTTLQFSRFSPPIGSGIGQ